MKREDVLPGFTSTPIDESVLRELGKSLTSILRDQQDSNDYLYSTNWLKDVLDALLTTANVPTLSAAHQVAACNTLCGFVEQCLRNKHSNVASTACNDDVRARLLVIYLNRVDSSRASTLKQVLNTTIKVIAKSCELNGNAKSLNEITETLSSIAFGIRDRSRAKAAFFMLTMLLKKDFISAKDLIVLHNNRQEQRQPNSDELLVADCRSVLEDTFRWMTVKDVAPAAGQFSCVLLAQYDPEEIAAGGSMLRQTLPIWAEPLLDALRDQMEEMHVFRTHAFTDIFSADPAGYWPFLEYLGFEEVFEPSATLSSDAMHDLRYKSNDFIVLFAALQAGRECGLFRQLDEPQGRNWLLQDGVVYVSAASIGRLCGFASPDARKASLLFLTSPPTSTKPFTFEALQAFKRYLPHMHADVDSNFRHELYGMLRSFIGRLRIIAASLARKFASAQAEEKSLGCNASATTGLVVSSEQIDNMKESLNRHKAFIVWYVGFLKTELHAHSPYQRHISALAILRMILKAGLDTSIGGDHNPNDHDRWPYNVDIIDGPLRRTLFDLLLDPYDDVRQTALDILCLASASSPTQARMPVRTVNTLQRAESIMLASGRVDHADGVARFYDLRAVQTATVNTFNLNGVATIPSEISAVKILNGLISRIEESLIIAEKDLAAAVARYPIHGLFTAIRYILERMVTSPQSQYREIMSQLMKIVAALRTSLSRTWQCVRSVLCNDAPEGFMPEELEDDVELTTKDVLSYSWRALKESSLVIRTLVSVAPRLLNLSNNEHQSSSVLKELGDLCFTQLAELRHRGAFSAVAQTFAVLCQQCVASKHDSSRQLVARWYNEALALIAQKGSVITRRSGGLPAIIIALLSADTASSLWQTCITDLKTMSGGYADRTKGDTVIDLPQVHALNTLKAIFTTSKLSVQSERYVVEILHIAASSLSTHIWAIRNCGLMLFRSLIDRILGSDESQHSRHGIMNSNATRFSYEDYPGLLDVLVNLLQAAETTLATGMEVGSSSDALFPVLDIFRRAPPPSAQSEQIVKLVLDACSSPSWHIRDMAARAYASLAGQKANAASLTSIVQLNSLDENGIHGRLLCLKYMVKGTPSGNVDVVERLANAVSEDFPRKTIVELGPMALATFLETWNMLVMLVMDIIATTGSPTVTQATVLGGGETSSHQSTSLYQTFARIARVTAQSVSPQAAHLQQVSVVSILITYISANFARSQGISVVPTDTQYETLLSLLRRCDEDAVIGALSWLSEHVTDLNQAVASRLLDVLVFDENEEVSDAVRGAIEAIVVKVFSSLSSLETLLSNNNVSAFLRNAPGSSDSSKQQAPSTFQTSLAIWGLKLAATRRAKAAWDPDTIQEGRGWIACIRAALAEQLDFPLRYVAVTSLKLFVHGQGSTGELPDDLAIELYSAIYDTMVDDDEEIRDTGSSVASALLDQGKVGAQMLMPPLACQTLCAHMIRKHSNSEFLIVEAMARLTRQQLKPKQCWRPVVDLLHAELSKEMSLFDEEKQNQYIDDVKEADTWSRMLTHVSVDACPQILLDHFSQWTMDGLEALLSATRKEIDGPLGWTSKADVFALGWRVLCAAEVLLEWRTKSARVEPQGSTIRRKLGELALEGEKQELHGLWLAKIEGIMTSSILKRVGRVGSILGDMPLASLIQ